VIGSEEIKETNQAARALSCHREVGENKKKRKREGRSQSKGGTN